ncbi:MAG: DUF2255 family protein [Neptuniibacter sp.]
MSFNSIAQRIHEVDVVGIRTDDFHEFLKMWVINVDGRLFARSWNKSSKSWYWAFKKAGCGIMLVDKDEYLVKAIIPSDDENLHLAINNAYKSRYGSGEASSIAKSMQDRSRWPMTIEFMILDK